MIIVRNARRLLARGRRVAARLAGALAFIVACVLPRLLGPVTTVQVPVQIPRMTPVGKASVGGDGRGAGGRASTTASAYLGAGTAPSKPMIRIFYNFYSKSRDDAPRVLDMISEQLRAADTGLHDVVNVTINSVGYKLPDILYRNRYVARHDDEGGEDGTLRFLWEYCRANRDRGTKVVYLHSKGSFHATESNDRLRQFLTEGALSRECADLPEECNVCSSRMSPHPHPHTPGNMWLARCDYVARLRDPFDVRERRLPDIFWRDDGCRGRGRFFFEGWAYSHPSVRPCDLYPGREFTFAYENVPGVDYDRELEMAPRFGFGVFARLLREKEKYCQEDTSPLTAKGYRESRREDYNMLYGKDAWDLDESWYLWDFLANQKDILPDKSSSQ